MHRSFFSFTKREMKTCVLLGTSLEVTSLLEITVFLAGMTDVEVSFSKNVAPDACIENTCARDAYIPGEFIPRVLALGLLV